MWNHRVLDASDENDGEPWLMFVECYYDKDGKPIGYSEICNGSETTKGLQTLCEHLRAACEQPILKKSDFKGE
jgi:hypothetical protein